MVSFPKEIIITIDQKTQASYVDTQRVYTLEFPDTLFRTATEIMWFKLKIGHKYKVTTTAGGFFDDKTVPKILEIVEEIR
jgi:hypothetical protein